jgi:hypothetical protein
LREEKGEAHLIDAADPGTDSDESTLDPRHHPADALLCSLQADRANDRREYMGVYGIQGDAMEREGCARRKAKRAPRGLTPACPPPATAAACWQLSATSAPAAHVLAATACHLLVHYSETHHP